MHELARLLGLTDASGGWYLFWSGFGSDLAYLGALTLFWRKVNCHTPGCFRIGRHHVAGTPYVTCRKHHPTA